MMKVIRMKYIKRALNSSILDKSLRFNILLVIVTVVIPLANNEPKSQ